jgi:3',5'-cyclic AMP phosphodiesterase CpdA
MRLLAISDINWLRYDRLVEVVENEEPDVLALAGDSWDDPMSRSKSRLSEFLRFIDGRRIAAFIVKGNWDQAEYDEFFHDQFEFVHEISGKYAHFNGFSFLGVPFSFFKALKALRRITSSFPQKQVDFVIAHPPTLRRIWLFDLEPKYILAGHDDNRVCKINGTLMICTNGSPETYAKVEVKTSGTTINYCDGNDRSVYTAEWRAGKLKWITREHQCDRPPHVYPARDSDYGKLLESLIQVKRSSVPSERPKKIDAPTSLLKEYLGTGMGNFA